MADHGSAQGPNVWPLPTFHFKVVFGAGDALEGAFSKVTGLSTEAPPIEYRAGNSKVFSTVKMPGITRVGNVTLKHGIFKSDDAFWSWYRSITQNTVQRQNVVITLLDERGSAAMTWTLTNAFPTKITGADLKAEGSEVAVTAIELAYETLNITTA